MFVEKYPQDKTRIVRVSARELETLEEAVVTQRFFELGAEYGDLVPDASERTIAVTQAGRTKTVRLRFLRDGDWRTPEIARALRIWYLVQGWFRDPDVTDLREYDQKFLGS